MVGKGVFIVQGEVFAIVSYLSRVRFFLAVRLVVADLCWQDRVG